MKSTFEYHVSARVLWTRTEVDVLMLLTKMHYDFACQELGRSGPIGSASNQLTWEPLPGKEPAQEVEVTLTSRTVNLICKLLEMSNYPGIPAEAKALDDAMTKLFKEMDAKFRELNPETP